MQCCTHRVRRAPPILGGEVPGLVPKSVFVFQEQLSQPATRTRIMTTFTTRPVSLRPSGVARSPLFPIGLALRLLEVELVFVLLEKPGFRRLGIMRTMAGERGVDGGLCVPRCYQPPAQFPSFETVAEPVLPYGGVVGWSGARIRRRQLLQMQQHRSSSTKQRFVGFLWPNSDPAPHSRQNRGR
jgi:hypothetical protein